MASAFSPQASGNEQRFSGCVFVFSSGEPGRAWCHDKRWTRRRVFSHHSTTTLFLPVENRLWFLPVPPAASTVRESLAVLKMTCSGFEFLAWYWPYSFWCSGRFAWDFWASHASS